LKKETEVEPTMVCRDCQTGKLRRKFVTYTTWMGEELITVPDFPAWVCDVCGRCEYDMYALNRLSLILSPTVGRPTPRSRPISRGDHPKDSRTGPAKKT